MTGLATHPKTSSSVETFVASPSQVLAIIGPEGAGKMTIATQIASQLLEAGEQSVLNHPNLHFIRRPEDKKDIPIESIRALITALKLRVPGNNAIKRVVLIENAHNMNQEGQNALLKTLEQPNPDTVFLFTLISATKILPTILSRSQKLMVYPVDQATATRHYRDSYNEPKISLAWSLSEGAPKLLDELLSGENHPQTEAIVHAKDFLSKNSYQRLLSLNDLSKDRQQLAQLLEALAKILKALHHSNIKKNNNAVANRVLEARKLTLYSQKSLEANAGAKLTMLNLIVNLNL